MLASPGLADSKLRVLAALTVNREDDFASGFVHVGDDVDNQRANKR